MPHQPWRDVVDSVVIDGAEIERLLARDFPETERGTGRAELTAAVPQEEDDALGARLHLAMLYFADGGLGRLRTARRLADADWRDFLVEVFAGATRSSTKESSEARTALQARDLEVIDRWRRQPWTMERDVAKVLLDHWDPIGAADLDIEPTAEYSSEAAAVVALLCGGAGRSEVVRYLGDWALELGRRNQSREQVTADRLFEWWSKLNDEPDFVDRAHCAL